MNAIATTTERVLDRAVNGRPLRSNEIEQQAVLAAVEYVNTDYTGVEHRSPRAGTHTFGRFAEAIACARALHDVRHDATYFVCEIFVSGGYWAGWYHVSQNGRVWAGRPEDWKPGQKSIDI